MYLILNGENIIEIAKSAKEKDGKIITDKSVIVLVGARIVEVNDIPKFVEPILCDYTEEGFVLNVEYQSELAHLKKLKMAELDSNCKEAILGKFSAKVNDKEYLFSFDADAQLNFSGALQFLNNNLLKEVEWTAYEGENLVRITMNKEQFIQVAVAGFLHKDLQIKKFRNTLQPRIEKAEKLVEVDVITW